MSDSKASGCRFCGVPAAEHDETFEPRSAPKAEAPMTREDLLGQVHGLILGEEVFRDECLVLIDRFALCIAAAARKEAEDETRAEMHAKFPLLGAKWLDPECMEACRSRTIEHSRQALADQLLGMGAKAMTELAEVRPGYDWFQELLAQHEERGAEIEELRDVMSRLADFPFAHQGVAEGPLAYILKQAHDALQRKP